MNAGLLGGGGEAVSPAEELSKGKAGAGLLAWLWMMTLRPP